MMGYTHAAIGAAGALAVASLNGSESPEIYLTAAIAGALGGVVVDIDTKDQRKDPKVTDAGRTRLATIGLVVLGLLLDIATDGTIISSIVSRQYFAMGGVIAFIVLMIIGHNTEHRTFSHSLLFSALTSVCIYFIYPQATIYYLVGEVLHLLLDMLNYPYKNHGIWLLYPIKTGRGIAFELCKSARTGNKICYFIGIISFAAISIYYMWTIGDTDKIASPIIVLVYIVVAFHFVRRKSEKEQRHIMHMRGEL